MTKDEAKEFYEQKRAEMWEAREQYNDAILKSFKEKYLDKFVKFTSLPSGDINTEPTYMFVENIWGNPDDRIYLEGPSFNWSVSEYADETNFYWSQWEQHTFTNSNYINGYGDELIINMFIITEDEYKTALMKGIEAMQKEEKRYEYVVKKTEEPVDVIN